MPSSHFHCFPMSSRLYRLASSIFILTAVASTPPLAAQTPEASPALLHGTVSPVETPNAGPEHKFVPSKVLKREPIS